MGYGKGSGGRASHYTRGAWKVTCDRCGHDFKSTQLRLEWTGLRVCSGAGSNDCWEERHPQDFVRGKPDRQSPPWTRAAPADVFISDVGEVSEDDL
jgi:hypothetical protein